MARAYFRHRIFIRFTYHPCRNYNTSRGNSLASSPPLSVAKISLFCLFSTSFPSFLPRKGSLSTFLHPLSFPRPLLLMDYVSPSLSIYSLFLSLSIFICFSRWFPVYEVSRKNLIYFRRINRRCTKTCKTSYLLL